MLNNWIMIAIAAGLAAATMHSTLLVPSAISILMFYVSPLPLLLAGLGWGPLAAIVAGAAGTLAVAVAMGFKPALFFAVTTAVAPAILCRLALLNRSDGQSGENEGEASDQGVQWYPEGRLLLWAAFMAGLLMTAVILITGPDAESFRGHVREMVDQIFAAGLKDQPQQLEELKPVLDMFVVAAPLISASFWLLAMLVNVWAASRILSKTGRSLRPWARFSDLAFPQRAGMALAAACFATFLPGTLGLIGQVFTSVFMTAFSILGLAVLHHLTIGHAARGFLLFSLYLALFILNWVLIVPLVAIALADMIFQIRQRGNASGPPANPT